MVGFRYWLIDIFHWAVRHEFSRGWQVAGPWSLQRELRMPEYVEGLALVDHQLSLNPFYGAHGYNTVHSDHRTWRAVQIPSGHRGHILTEARLCHQSHSTSRIFKGSKSINSWLHNCSMGTEKKNTLKNIWAQELNFTCTSKEKRKYKIC